MNASAPQFVDLPFPAGAHPQAQPGRIAPIAALCGLEPASPGHCRMLELGCGAGENLISAALFAPDGEFVGIDVGPAAVDAARATLHSLGLTNVTFHLCDVANLPESLGTFDYVVVPGVYSWVPEATRDALLAACRRHLRPGGVAHVSYNVLPGARVATMVREMMLFHAGGAVPDAARGDAAIELLRMLAGAPAGAGPIHRVLEAEYRRILDSGPVVAAHDEAAPVNDPILFCDFVGHARRHGLEFLGESDWAASTEADLPEALRELLSRWTSDPVARAQYVDFIRCRRFRHTLLRRSDVTPSPRPPTSVIERFHVAPGSRARDTAPLPAQGAAAATNAAPPAGDDLDAADVALVTEAMAIVAESWPRTLPFAELHESARGRATAWNPGARRTHAESAQVLAEALFDAFEIGLLDFHLGPVPCARSAGERPLASPLARRQARERAHVTSLFHENVKLPDPVSRAALALLDGTRDRAAILDALRASDPHLHDEGLETLLGGFARAGLLLA